MNRHLLKKDAWCVHRDNKLEVDMRKVIVVLLVILLLAGLVLAVSAGKGGGGGGGSNDVAKWYCKYQVGTDMTMNFSRTTRRGTGAIRGDPVMCPSPTPKSSFIGNA
jgi:hypothetical protein